MYLQPHHIHLIPMDEKHTLFFHTESLKIYLLENDNILIPFLQSFKKNSSEEMIALMGEDEYHKTYQYLCDNIGKHSLYQPISQEKALHFNNVILPIASHCNLSCPYCFARKGGKFHFADYNENDIIKILNFLDKNNPVDESVTLIFFGGEPLLKLDIIEFTIRYVKANFPKGRFNYSITTNGTLLNERILTLIKENHMAVLLSIDGPDNEFNLRKYRNNKKSLPTVLRNIEILRAYGIPIELRATLVNTNPYICETFDFFENLKVPFDIVFAYSSENTNHHYADYQDNTLSQIQIQFDALYYYYKQKILAKKNIYNNVMFNRVKTLQYRSIQEYACAAGINFFTIMSNGDLYTCAHLFNNNNYCVGNIYDNTIKWDVLKNLRPIHVNKINGCTDCWVKNLCLGGCVSQKVTSNLQNDMPCSLEVGELQKIQWNFYLKIYALIVKYAPEYIDKSTKQTPNPC